jgi:hypothetical protein
MPDHELLYDLPSPLIAVGLLVLLLIGNLLGYRLGLWSRRRAPNGVRTQANAIQAATLGLLALLLGFSFSMALQRYDARVQAVVAEANTLGTARLRSDLLPEPLRTQARSLLNDYLVVRLRSADLSLDRRDARYVHWQETTRLQEALWRIAAVATAANPAPVPTGQFVHALNELFDATTQRAAALDAHVPEAVLLLLFGVFGVSGGIIGYAGGIEGGQPRVPTLLMAVLIVLVMFMIIDLDRPRRGLIKVPQTAMQALLPPG